MCNAGAQHASFAPSKQPALVVTARMENRNIKRFQFYQQHWEKHLASQKLERELRTKVACNIESLEAGQSALTDFTWLTQAFPCSARMTPSHTECSRYAIAWAALSCLLLNGVSNIDGAQRLSKLHASQRQCMAFHHSIWSSKSFVPSSMKAMIQAKLVFGDTGLCQVHAIQTVTVHFSIAALSTEVVACLHQCCHCHVACMLACMRR